jgi:hypothetical protein
MKNQQLLETELAGKARKINYPSFGKERFNY